MFALYQIISMLKLGKVGCNAQAAQNPHTSCQRLQDRLKYPWKLIWLGGVNPGSWARARVASGDPAARFSPKLFRSEAEHRSSSTSEKHVAGQSLTVSYIDIRQLVAYLEPLATQPDVSNCSSRQNQQANSSDHHHTNHVTRVLPHLQHNPPVQILPIPSQASHQRNRRPQHHPKRLSPPPRPLLRRRPLPLGSRPKRPPRPILPLRRRPLAPHYLHSPQLPPLPTHRKIRHAHLPRECPLADGRDLPHTADERALGPELYAERGHDGHPAAVE